MVVSRVLDDRSLVRLTIARMGGLLRTHGRGAVGIHHLGIQVDDNDELAEVYERLKSAGRPVIEEGETVCRYAQVAKTGDACCGLALTPAATTSSCCRPEAQR
jgi:hypothetical protein